MLDGSNSSGQSAINAVADASEAEIGNYFGNLSEIDRNGEISPNLSSSANSLPPSPTEGVESGESVPGVHKSAVVDDIGVFTAGATDNMPDVSAQQRCSPEEKLLIEAREASAAIWNSWVMNHKKHGLKRAAPKNFTEAFEKVRAEENVLYDCVMGLESLKIPCSKEEEVPLPVLNSTNCDSDPPKVPPVMMGPSVSSRSLMDEVRPVSGLLSGNMPPAKKTCPAAAYLESSVESTPVIGCSKSGSSNGKQE